MIKILKQGKKKIHFYMYKKKCSKCGCKYLYENEDIICLGIDRTPYVYCPQCSCANLIFLKRKCKVE